MKLLYNRYHQSLIIPVLDGRNRIARLRSSWVELCVGYCRSLSVSRKKSDEGKDAAIVFLRQTLVTGMQKLVYRGLKGGLDVTKLRLSGMVVEQDLSSDGASGYRLIGSL